MSRGRGERFTALDRKIIDRYVLQGVQNNATVLQIKEELEEKEKINISYGYLASVVSKTKQEIIDKRQGITRETHKPEPNKGKRFTADEKEIIEKYIAEGVDEGIGGIAIRKKLKEEQGIEISQSRMFVNLREYKEREGKSLEYSKPSKHTNAEKEKINEAIASGDTGYAIAEKLNRQGIEITLPMVYYYIQKYKKEHPEQQPIQRRTFNTPAERLYFARGNIIKMKRNGFTDKDIADEYRVSEADVQEFFTRRKYVRPEQYREIIYKSTKGATPEELAEEYGLNVDTVRKILTTKQRAISRDVEPETETQQEFDLNVARNFIKFINTLMTCKEIKSDDEEILNKERLDILHELELKELSQEEKLKMLDRIAELGRLRREAKDYNEIFKPVMEFLGDEGNLNLIKIFANRVAEAVNKLKDTSTRVYFLRSET